MTGDPRDLSELLVESQDLQSDAVAEARFAGQELVARSDEVRAQEGLGDPSANRRFAEVHRLGLHKSLAGTTALGAAGGALLVGLLASPAFASSSPDIQMLQTAASLEVLAVSTYKTALTLPYIGGSSANPVVKKFAQVTMSQHEQHQAAFNALIKTLHGKPQTNPDPVYVPVVKKAVAGLAGASPSAGAMGVVNLALELEQVAAETYVNDMGSLKHTKAKQVTASIMGVEAQHAATLMAVRALLAANQPQDIALSPTTVASLPAAAGSVGFPHSFYPTNQAAPAKQGAVK